MRKLIVAFRHYANAPENRLLAQEIERRFLGRPFRNLVFIPSSFVSDLHTLTNASLHPSAVFVDVGRQPHAGLDVQYCVGLYGVCMSVPREGTQSECRFREERSYSGEYHEYSECKYPRNDCKTLRSFYCINSTNGFNPYVSCIVGISNAIRFFPDLLTD
jgi:hypothetical protein